MNAFQNEKNRTSWLRVACILGFLFFVMPMPRALVQPWTVRVVDTSGAPVAGVHVAEEWEDYAFSISGRDEQVTDSSGQVVFKRKLAYRPAAFYAGAALSNLVMLAHASWGMGAHVIVGAERVPDDHAPHGYWCSSRKECSAGPRHTEIRIARHVYRNRDGTD
jgi:hypothetical protein